MAGFLGLDFTFLGRDQTGHSDENKSEITLCEALLCLSGQDPWAAPLCLINSDTAMLRKEASPIQVYFLGKMSIQNWTKYKILSSVSIPNHNCPAKLSHSVVQLSPAL